MFWIRFNSTNAPIPPARTPARSDPASYDGTSTLPEGSMDDSFLVP